MPICALAILRGRTLTLTAIAYNWHGNFLSSQTLLNSPRINFFRDFLVSHVVLDPRVLPVSEAFHK